MDNVEKINKDKIDGAFLGTIILGYVTVVISMFVPIFGYIPFGAMVYLSCIKKNRLAYALSICVGIFLVLYTFIYIEQIFKIIQE